MINKIFRVLDKVDSALTKAEKVSNTAGRIERQGNRLKSSKSNMWRWIVAVLVIVVAVLLFIYG